MTPRCKFGRAHLWIRRPGTELDECATCGRLSYDTTFPEAPRPMNAESSKTREQWKEEAEAANEAVEMACAARDELRRRWEVAEMATLTALSRADSEEDARERANSRLTACERALDEARREAGREAADRQVLEAAIRQSPVRLVDGEYMLHANDILSAYDEVRNRD